MRPQVSVVICAHNPRKDYLQRVLTSLSGQTLAKDRWELLLIDNASARPIAEEFDLTWHENGRHIHERELGISRARLCGIREFVGELLVFVDDDNVLAEDYLEVALRLAGSHPHIGVFGGSLKGEFESPPPEWIRPYLPGLAIRDVDRDYWSNLAHWSEACPCGAGMCVKRVVAEDYARKVSANPVRKALGRTGAGMGAGEDLDIAFCAIDIGMGTACFRDLSLTHLIAQNRLTLSYITKLKAGMAFSDVVLESFRAKEPPRRVPKWRETLRLMLTIAQGKWKERGIPIAVLKARREARNLIGGSAPKDCNILAEGHRTGSQS